ncbi:MAG: signal recognition particle-docking protein FtsY [Actinomycetota bacterium]
MGLVIAIVVVLLVLVGVGTFVVVRRRGRTVEGPAVREAEMARPAPREPELTAPAAVPPALRVPVREGLGARIRGLFSGGTPTEEEWRRLEEVLVRADVGPHAAKAIVERVKERYGASDDPAQLLAEEIAEALAGEHDLDVATGRLSVVMVVGVNGSGKTTSIGKLAARLTKAGYKISLANSDTFRAAASEQLSIWADRTGAHLVAQSRGADPGAVAFDAVQAAKARGSDVLLVDTAGRLHTRTPLMDELQKVKRVLEKAHGRSPEEVLLVLDGTTGQNGIAQARAFTEAVGVTGVILTKLDGTARGGIVVAVRDEPGVPVKLVGTGEGTEDLAPFDPHAFAAALVA